MDTRTILYSTEAEVQSFGIEVPRWVEQDIDANQVAAILEGGCESGAYMPAVTYSDALETMGEHGDRVMDFIEEQLGAVVPQPSAEASWAGMACHFMSLAVELWASSIEDELAEAIQERDNDEA